MKDYSECIAADSKEDKVSSSPFGLWVLEMKSVGRSFVMVSRTQQLACGREKVVIVPNLEYLS